MTQEELIKTLRLRVASLRKDEATAVKRLAGIRGSLKREEEELRKQLYPEAADQPDKPKPL